MGSMLELGGVAARLERMARTSPRELSRIGVPGIKQESGQFPVDRPGSKESQN
jgi:hypothetical protein